MPLPKYEPITDNRFQQLQEHQSKDAFWTTKAEELYGAEPAFRRFRNTSAALFFIPAIALAVGITYFAREEVSGWKIVLIPLIPFVILGPLYLKYVASYCRGRILKDPAALAKIKDPAA